MKRDRQKLPGQAIESYIASKFDDLATDTSMFPENISADDWQLRAIRQALGEVTGKKILDIGCGKGKFARPLQAAGAQVLGIDISQALLDVAKSLSRGITYTLGSATRIPAASSTFDGATCVEVLEHVPDLDMALKEIVRVLKPGGRLVVIDKNIAGFHPVWPYPIALHKWQLERKNQWMYPADGPFRERWFTARGLKKNLLRYFGKVEVHYPERERPILAGLRRLFPWLSYDILWAATKDED